MELTSVELSDPHQLSAERIAVGDYRSAGLDQVIAEAYVAAAHLNEYHAPDLLRLGSLLTDASTDLVGTLIHAVDRTGLGLTVIDVAGARDVELVFRAPLTSVGDLANQLHRLIHDPAAYLRG